MTSSDTLSKIFVILAGFGSGSMAGYGYYNFLFTASGHIAWQVFGVLLSLWVAGFVGYRVAASYDLYEESENPKFKATVNEMRL